MNSETKPKRAPARKKAYKMPEKVPKGEILKDSFKNTWSIVESVGVGGFGEIYSATKCGDPGSARYVVKIEPKENGPLFCERTVYVNIGKKEFVDEFIKEKKLKMLGFPAFYGFGSHTLRDVVYRFIVIERLGKDLWSYFLSNNRSLPLPAVLKIGIQILYVLEYMHRRGYCHGDIKGANLLLGVAKGSENQVYLVDFGLASKFGSTYKPDPKKAHNGTLEYLSRDAHLGVQTRRGDLEILVYNLLQWHSSRLPWEHLTEPPAVQLEKERLMKDSSKLIDFCYTSVKKSQGICDLLNYVNTLEPLDEPDYDKARSFLSKELTKLGGDNSKLDLVSTNTTKLLKTPKKKPSKKSAATAEEETPQSLTKKRKLDKSNGTGNKTASRASPRKHVIANGTESKKPSWRDLPTIVNGAVPKK